MIKDEFGNKNKDFSQFKKIEKHAEDTLSLKNGPRERSRGVEKKVIQRDITYERPKKIFKDQAIYWCQDIEGLPGFYEMKKSANKLFLESEINETDKKFVIVGKIKKTLKKTEKGLVCGCQKFKTTSKEEAAPYCKHYFAVLIFKIWKNWNQDNE